MTAPNFPLLPDGGSPVVERIEFATALSTAHDGTESARPLRALPRHGFSATYIARNEGAGAEALAMLQTGLLLHVPYAPHAGSAGAGDALDFGVNADAPLALVGAAEGVSLVDVPTVGGLPMGSRWVAPSVDAYLGGNRSFEWLTDGYWRAQVSFSLADSYREAVPAWEGPLVLQERHNWVVKPVESRTAEQDALDYGRRFLLAQRFVKRAVRLQLLLRGRPAIQAFRSLFYALQGRFGTFAYMFPADPAPKTWRLGADAVEIEYVTRAIGRVQLEIVEVSE